MAREKENNNLSIWKKIESRWPILGYSGNIDFYELKNKFEDFLFEKEIKPKKFSHFGFVVNNIDSSISALRNLSHNKDIKDPIMNWVEVLSLHVARITFENIELEFLLPKGKSFFKNSLEKGGESLHHLAFEVDNIESSLFKLKEHRVKLLNEKPLQGAHGKVAFSKPNIFSQVYLELYQKNDN